MSDLWGVDVTHWWLPNDEGFPDIIRSIRDFIEYRARLPADTWGADVRDMNGIFRALDLSEPDDREHEQMPEGLKSAATDSDAWDQSLEHSMTWDSSPDQQQWQQ